MLLIQGDSFNVDGFYKILFGLDTKKEVGVLAMYIEHNYYYHKLVCKAQKKDLLAEMLKYQR